MKTNPLTLDVDRGEQPLPRVGVAAIVVNGPKILLGQTNKTPIAGQWVLPGGGVEPFESIFDTVKREFKAETNLDIQPGQVLFVDEILDRHKNQHRIIIYVEATILGEADLKAGDDLNDVRWVDVRELGDMQDSISDATINALHKFSVFLKARKMARLDQPL